MIDFILNNQIFKYYSKDKNEITNLNSKRIFHHSQENFIEFDKESNEKLISGQNLLNAYFLMSRSIKKYTINNFISIKKVAKSCSIFRNFFICNKKNNINEDYDFIDVLIAILIDEESSSNKYGSNNSIFNKDKMCDILNSCSSENQKIMFDKIYNGITTTLKKYVE